MLVYETSANIPNDELVYHDNGPINLGNAVGLTIPSL